MCSDPSLEFEAMIQSARSQSDSLVDLLEKYRPLLYRIAGQHLRPDVRVRVDMSDIVQETMILATRRFEQFTQNSEIDFRVWVEGLCRHAIDEAHRKHVGAEKRTVRRETHLQKRSQSGRSGVCDITGTNTTPSQRVVRCETGEALRAHLDKLTGLQAQAVRMRYFEQLSTKEIAHRLDCSLEATAGLLKRGLRKLKQLIESESRL
jgi:RNA polymerase sigma-70 factor, ECF subfamily